MNLILKKHNDDPQNKIILGQYIKIYKMIPQKMMETTKISFNTLPFVLSFEKSETTTNCLLIKVLVSCCINLYYLQWITLDMFNIDFECLQIVHVIKKVPKEEHYFCYTEWCK